MHNVLRQPLEHLCNTIQLYMNLLHGIYFRFLQVTLTYCLSRTQFIFNCKHTYARASCLCLNIIYKQINPQIYQIQSWKYTHYSARTKKPYTQVITNKYQKRPSIQREPKIQALEQACIPFQKHVERHQSSIT